MLRRNILRSLFFAAPAIVAAPTLMRVSAKFLLPETWDIAAMAREACRIIASHEDIGLEQFRAQRPPRSKMQAEFARILAEAWPPMPGDATPFHSLYGSLLVTPTISTG